MEKIEKLIEDLSGDKPIDVINTAMNKLLQIDVEQVNKTVLIPLIEDAIRKAAFESDFIHLDRLYKGTGTENGVRRVS